MFVRQDVNPAMALSGAKGLASRERCGRNGKPRGLLSQASAWRKPQSPSTSCNAPTLTRRPMQGWRAVPRHTLLVTFGPGLRQFFLILGLWCWPTMARRRSWPCILRLDGNLPRPVCSDLNGLGLPDRRWAPGTSWGPFCFLGRDSSRKHLQAVARDHAVSPGEQLGRQDVPRPVWLVGPQNV